MSKVDFRALLEETYKSKIQEAEEDEDLDDTLDDEDDEESISDEDMPADGDDYTPDDLREVIDYVYEILDEEDDGEVNDSVGEVGLDLMYEYCDTFPQATINQIVKDLKDTFEIEDSVMESIVTEGAVFVKSKKGAVAKALKKKAKMYYKKNKAKVKMAAKKWRKSATGKKVIKLHQKMLKKFKGKMKKGMRLVTAPTEIAAEK